MIKRFAGLFAAVFAAAYSFPSAAQTPAWTQGIYFRADLGGGFGQDTTFTDTNPNAPNSVLGTFTVPVSTGNSVIFGGGVGYRFSPIFRSDLTLDYLPSLGTSGNISPSPLPPLSFPLAGNLSSLVGLVNGYIDINGLMPNTFGSFQPYLTAGIGFSQNDLGTESGSVLGVHYSVSSNTNTDLAWGVGAGVAYPITPNWAVDLAYKFLSLGEIRTGTTAVASAGSFIASGTVTQAKADLYVHTVMLGLRYRF